MRVCLFGPDLPVFEQGRLRRSVPERPAAGIEEVLVSNSRGLPPADGTHVHITGGARTRRMRGLRWLAARQRLGPPLTALARFGVRLNAGDLLEGLRGADPDVVVSLDSAWTPLLRDCIRHTGMPWPCIEADDALPADAADWRRYDAETRVSIVLPTFNGMQYLGQSIASCLAQTHRRIEIVLVDDGSGPEVEQCVRGFGDPRLKYIRHAVNRGLPAALNTGFAAAAGDLLTWTSDDNLYAPDAIEQMVRFLSTYPDVDFVYADAHEIDKEGRVVGVLWVEPPDWLRVKNRVGGCFLYRRRVYETLGGYDQAAVLAEDYDYWLRVARRFTMQRLFRILYSYRYHPRSLTSSSTRENVQRQAERVKRANRSWWRSTRFGGAT